jgi:putative transposase
MKINYTYKYRIYPTEEQQESLAKQFGAKRFVYNHFLNLRINTYALTGRGLSYNTLANILTDMKKEKEYEWLREADSQVLQQALRDLDSAYNNFFNKWARFPRFKKKHGAQSIRYPQRFKLEGSKLYLPKVGWVKIVLHRPIEGEMRNLTISKTKSGKYFASICVEREVPNPTYKGEKVGIDLGLKDFAITSEGQRFGNPKFLAKSEEKLKKSQRKLSRTKKGSKGREIARLRVARQHEKIANQRQDFLHKLSRQLVEENQLIVIEDLCVQGMVRNHKLAKAISDVSWSEFVRQLTYKGEWYGCRVEKIDRFFPSSKRCFHCGFINDNLKLSDRRWVCPNCGCILDRDVNAAQNILNWYRAGTARINADGQNIRLDRISSSSLDEVRSSLMG